MKYLSLFIDLEAQGYIFEYVSFIRSWFYLQQAWLYFMC